MVACVSSVTSSIQCIFYYIDSTQPARQHERCPGRGAEEKRWTCAGRREGCKLCGVSVFRSAPTLGSHQSNFNHNCGYATCNSQALTVLCRSEMMWRSGLPDSTSAVLPNAYSYATTWKLPPGGSCPGLLRPTPVANHAQL
eukprot:jgi/Ulvmu1/2534/UM139_0001.1